MGIFRKRFPGLERRKFALPQKFVSLQSIDLEAQQQHNRPTGRSNYSGLEIFF